VDWIHVAQNRAEFSAVVDTKQWYPGLIEVGECVGDSSEWHIAITLAVLISCDFYIHGNDLPEALQQPT